MLAALAVHVTGCASPGAVPRPFPMPARAEASPPEAGVEPEGPLNPTDHAPTGRRPGPVIDTALTLLGSPYLNGGSTPEGFDCSGFTQWVFAQHGISLPRETRDQFREGVTIDAAAIAAGDLVFFSTVARGASHVGIALDEDRFVHAPSSRGIVRVERRSSAYWKERYVGARRLTSGDAPLLTR
jgi:cell wall-associated NlpC family hydrolase